LLYLTDIDLGEQFKGSVLLIYNEEEGSMGGLLSPTNVNIFDFAWNPEQPVFIVTQGDRMTLYRKDTLYGYRGMAIRCPVDFLYTYCSWDPKGRWLAVNSHDFRTGVKIPMVSPAGTKDTDSEFFETTYKHASGRKLGLYELKEEKFTISDIIIDHNPLVWDNEDTIYATNGDNILEIKLTSGVPRLVRTIPIEEEVTRFFGMFDNQPLVWKDKKIKLGNTTLVELNQNSRNRVITTKTNIFVSASSSHLVVFNHKGQEISRTDPGELIDFGSIGKNPDTIYGLAESKLLRISLENANLKIQEVCNFADF
jgi:hypothetical protein